jgi:hypothetical protein
VPGAKQGRNPVVQRLTVGGGNRERPAEDIKDANGNGVGHQEGVVALPSSSASGRSAHWPVKSVTGRFMVWCVFAKWVAKKSCHPELVEIRDFEKPMGHGGKSPTVSHGCERENR